MLTKEGWISKPSLLTPAKVCDVLRDQSINIAPLYGMSEFSSNKIQNSQRNKIARLGYRVSCKSHQRRLSLETSSEMNFDHEESLGQFDTLINRTIDESLENPLIKRKI